jgi:hypothetical protein
MEREIFPATPPGRTLFSENIMVALPDGISLREMLPDAIALLDCRLPTGTTTTFSAQPQHSGRTARRNFTAGDAVRCQMRRRFFNVAFQPAPGTTTTQKNSLSNQYSTREFIDCVH